ncbi:MAG TPA: 4a-hydroxytetrahydrobiopterin dehydratase [Acidimicrobiales bacterium]|nr:4a-hydroxytetrahydrobiopterin dehydratase [Acidimicrobiales bacterium]
MERLDDATVTAGIEGTRWRREGDRLRRTSRHGDFRAAMAFVNAVAELAEARNHHPDIAVHWDTVELTLWTHTAGGVTAADLELAGALDALPGG